MESTSPSLLERLRQPNDEIAWKRFVEIYTPLFREFGQRLGLENADSLDLTQDLYLILLRRLPNFEYEPGRSFRRFLWKCYVRLAKRWFQEKRGSWPAGLEVASEDRPLMENAEFQEYVLSRALQVMKSRFEEPVWKAFQEVQFNGLTAREVERSLGIPRGNVWVYCGRVRQALRQELAGLLH